MKSTERNFKLIRLVILSIICYSCEGMKEVETLEFGPQDEVGQIKDTVDSDSIDDQQTNIEDNEKDDIKNTTDGKISKEYTEGGILNRKFQEKLTWSEGNSKYSDDGATYQYLNKGAQFKWVRKGGDWLDAKGILHGPEPYSTQFLGSIYAGEAFQLDGTEIVKSWVNGTAINHGFRLNPKGNKTIILHSRESLELNKRPKLILELADKRIITLQATGDTYLNSSTSKSQGHLDFLTINGGVYIRFDNIKGLNLKERDIVRANLELTIKKKYSGTNITAKLYRAHILLDSKGAKKRLGLASNYNYDYGILGDPNVLFFEGFEELNWKKKWDLDFGERKVIKSDDLLNFQELSESALKVTFKTGLNTALNSYINIKDINGGVEPDDLYFRYYVRLASDWDQNIEGGKFPGFAGTYDKAGWGGRKPNGYNGWSTRGAYITSMKGTNPLKGFTGIGNYIYHVDQIGAFGGVYVWEKNYKGVLGVNEWYCIEQHVKLNTPGEKDGVLETWVDGVKAYERTNIRFRLTNKLKIQRMWFNFYHGGLQKPSHDMSLYIDNIVISKKYIGPLKGEVKSNLEGDSGEFIGDTGNDESDPEKNQNGAVSIETPGKDVDDTGEVLSNTEESNSTNKSSDWIGGSSSGGEGAKPYGDGEKEVSKGMWGLEFIPRGHWYEVPNSKPIQLDPCHDGSCLPGRFKNLVEAWSGGVFDSKRNRLVLFGGGHADYAGNEVIAFDLDNLKWNRITEPYKNLSGDRLACTSKQGKIYNTYLFETCGFYPKKDIDISIVLGSHRKFYKDTGCHGYIKPEYCELYSDLMNTQQPRSRHSYNNLEYIPSTDSMCSFGMSVPWPSGQTGHGHVDCFSFGSGKWYRNKKLQSGELSPSYGGFAIQEKDKVWLVGGGSTASLGYYEPAINDYNTQSYPRNPWGGWRNYKTPAIDEETRQLVGMGMSEMIKWDLNNPRNPPIKLNPTGDSDIIKFSSPGMDYSSSSKSIVAWKGGSDIYYYSVKENKWTRRSGGGTPPGAANQTGVFGRFKYSKKFNVFVLVNNADSNVFLYRPLNQGEI